jgi:hypothetical protein
LRVALNDAVRRRLISYNPAANVELPVSAVVGKSKKLNPQVR